MMRDLSPSVSLRILLVEDSHLLRAMLREMLNDLENVQVVATAADEATALLHLSQRPLDMVIVDLELAEGSGLGVLQKLHEHPEVYGDPKRTVFSNYCHQTLRTRCQAFKVTNFFDKSFQLDDLLDYIQQAAQQLTQACVPILKL